jgi:Xaa-Pro dipeptidase
MRERTDLPFAMDEYRARLENVRGEMERRGIDLLVLFAPENLYYLTAYNTKGYYTYQCLLIPLRAEPMFITRHLEADNVRYHTWVERVEDYRDEDDPMALTRRVLGELGAEEARLGVEMNSWFLIPETLDKLRQALPRAEFVNASGLVEQFRMIKSPAEIEYLRQAARAASAGMKAAIGATREGVLDNEPAAAAYSARTLAGSEYVSSPVYVVAGPKSGLAHNTWEGRRMQRGDVVFYEIGASVKRYHAGTMRSAVIGEPTDYVRRAAEASMAGLRAALEVLGPGVKASEADAACRETIRALGYGPYHHHRLGYHMGVAFPPTWVQRDVFSLNVGVEERLQPGMVFHLVPAILIPEVGGLGNSETVLITESGNEVLTDVELKLFVR